MKIATGLLLGMCLAVWANGATPTEAEPRVCPDCGQGYALAAERIMAVRPGTEAEPGIEDSS